MRSAEKSDISVERLEKAFQNRTLIHPLSTDRPTTVELFSALRDLCGPPHERTTEASENIEAFIDYARRYVVVLIDGLGDCFQHMLPDGGFLANTHRMPLVTGFPSSTAPMLTSFATASWPSEHGISGWHTYFREHSRTMTVLPFIERDTGMRGEELGLSLPAMLPVHSWYPDRDRNVVSVLPQGYVNSAYSSWSRGGTRGLGYRNLRQAAKRILQTAAGSTSEQLIYCYVPALDATAHKFGCGSEEVRRELMRLDSWLGELRRRLSDDTRLLVVGDHGLIDTIPDRYFKMNERSFIMQYLSAPPSGEPAVPIFHVTPGNESAFLRYFQESEYAPYFDLITPDQADLLHLYGPEPLSPLMRRRLGSFIGVASTPAVMEYVPHGQCAIDFRAVHGGLRPDEMYVTLYMD
ncbi:alkaline phosphatase family protein [Spirochaeta africana]|uniref:Putative AP superfamily protein n=1 Tax=Spirochaeta africana (strain ATCC 700263 / DSM 8902 / Z-7692) TaxID=889378 RepID=H9UJ07_SPIAZ|nr:alkaline phosphatase family protein [Spirochaeta africana]AFG37500.1 putative AP superfamily protein [Spirochaeta africana DSM 8902]